MRARGGGAANSASSCESSSQWSRAARRPRTAWRLRTAQRTFSVQIIVHHVQHGALPVCSTGHLMHSMRLPMYSMGHPCMADRPEHFTKSSWLTTSSVGYYCARRVCIRPCAPTPFRALLRQSEQHSLAAHGKSALPAARPSSGLKRVLARQWGLLAQKWPLFVPLPVIGLHLVCLASFSCCCG